jgi:hypothetical protein
MAEDRSSDRESSGDESPGLALNIPAKRITQVLILIALFFTLASVAVQVAKVNLGLGNLRGLVPLFTVGNDESIATWYSTAVLLLCFAFLAAIAVVKKITNDRYFLYWAGLSVVFLYLSADEHFSIHERLGRRIGQFVLDAAGIAQEGILRRAWVVFGIGMVLIVTLVFLRFFIALPPKTRRIFFIAGLLFVSGAIGLEMAAAFYLDLYGGGDNMTLAQNTVRTQLPNVEEFLEMLGVIVFLYALMSYINAQAKNSGSVSARNRS